MIFFYINYSNKYYSINDIPHKTQKYPFHCLIIFLYSLYTPRNGATKPYLLTKVQGKTAVYSLKSILKAHAESSSVSTWEHLTSAYVTLYGTYYHENENKNESLRPDK